MRILHVIPYMHPRAGGPPVVVENFVREASRLGHSSEIMSTTLLCHGDEQQILMRLNELAPTKFLGGSTALVVLQKASRRELGKHVAAADIVHAHTLWSPINIIVRKASAYYNRPYVLMPHGMLDPYSLRVKSWRKKLYLWSVEKRNICASERLIYTTEEEQRLATSELPWLPKAVVVPLGGDAPAQPLERLAAEFYAKFPIAKGRRQLLFLGRLHFKKGLDRILSVMPRIVETYPDVMLTIAGVGEVDYESSLKDIIDAKGLHDKVVMTGHLDGMVKWGAYASAELFLLPSRQENFAISIAEAMHAGVPVLISNKVNTWPYVEAANAGIVLDEGRIETEIGPTIIGLLSDAESLKGMGRRGQAYAKANLTWATAGRKMIDCYDEVLASAHSTGTRYN